MALTFPSSPTNGQIFTDTATGYRYIYNATAGVWAFSSNNVGMSVSSTPPGNVGSGSMWYNREIGRTFVYYNDGDSSQWVETVPAGAVDTNTIAAYTNPVFASMNGAYTTANSAYASINSNWTVTNSAFGVANTALQNTSGTFAGNLVVTGNVGIGTASPTYPIHAVSGSGSTVAGYFAGSSGNFALALNHTGGYNMYLGTVGNTNESLKFINSGGTELMRLDNSGRLTTPYQPLFYGSRNGTGGWTSGYNSTAVFNYNTTYLNIGSSYNTSTGTFTCPIAGYYRVHASILVGNNNSSMGIFLYKNGAQYGEQGYHASNGPVVLLPMTWVVSCAANDTLKIYAQCASGPGVFDNGYNYLNIELVG